MSNLIYPPLPGLTFGNTRTPVFSTSVQTSLTGKESRLANRAYPNWKFELQYELLRDYIAPSDLKALVGLFMEVQGQYDTFLYTDPSFNSVTAQPFGTGDGTTAAFQLKATYENSGGPGLAEIIQNVNGTPSIYVGGVLQTSGTAYTLGATGIVTFLAGHIPAAAAALTWTGSFYYRVRFDTDAMTVTQFLNNFWENKKVSLQQVKL